MFLQSTQLKELCLPDFITITGLTLAILSIFFSINGLFLYSFLAILGQYIFDILDGIIARKYGGGKLGLFMDSFSDYTSIIAVVFFGFFSSNQSILFIISGICFIIFASIRLSFFTDRSLKNKNDFIGLPTVFVIFLISTFIIINYFFNFFNTSYTPFLYFVGAYLMVADIKIKKIKI